MSAECIIEEMHAKRKYSEVLLAVASSSTVCKEGSLEGRYESDTVTDVARVLVECWTKMMLRECNSIERCMHNPTAFFLLTS